MLRFLTKLKLPLQPNQVEDKMLSQMKLVLTLMKVHHTKDTHRMQKKLMVVGL